MSEFVKELKHLINRYSQENGSNTPDFVLAEYLNDCLSAFDKAVNTREKWYGRAVNLLNKAGEPIDLTSPPLGEPE